ncbi:hypothetical protein U0070_003522 [Myodes glareolus]|uniref:Phospholipase A2-like central domain-containing protein n=1 Tax=Myodes glareolus TaxID=447135 RepID=A0AAW0JU50_MYOGA
MTRIPLPSGDREDTDRCCWKHQQCAVHPFSDCGHHEQHMHTVRHCNCESRLKDCSEKTNSSSSRDVGPTCSREGDYNTIHTPCFELIPEEECVERIWYSWCKRYRPLSVAVIHHPHSIHHTYRTDDLTEEEVEVEEEEEEEAPFPIPTQLCPTNTPTDSDIRPVTRVPDSAAPITIWRSESPTDKSQEGKVIKKISKKKKEKEKDKEEEMVDEKAKLKKNVKKGKLTKKKSPVKSASSPPDLTRSLSPRELVRTSESSPESREEPESEDSYERNKEGHSSEDIVEPPSPKKKEKSTAQTKKNGTKNLQNKKTIKRKSPPVSNPNLS